MQKIDLNKTYQTKDGAKVKLLSTFISGDHSEMIVGLVENSNGTHWASRWYADTGELIRGALSGLDLVECDQFKEFRDLPVDAPIWVRDSEVDDWYPRHWKGLSGSNSHPFSAFCEGQTYHSMQDEAKHMDWKYCSIKNPYKS